MVIIQQKEFLYNNKKIINNKNKKTIYLKINGFFILYIQSNINIKYGYRF